MILGTASIVGVDSEEVVEGQLVEVLLPLERQVGSTPDILRQRIRSCAYAMVNH